MYCITVYCYQFTVILLSLKKENFNFLTLAYDPTPFLLYFTENNYTSWNRQSWFLEFVYTGQMFMAFL